MAGFLLAPGETAGTSSRAMRRKLAAALLGQGMDTSPVGHWTQGAARMAQSLVGGMEMNRLDTQEKTEREEANRLLAQVSGGIGTPNTAAGPMAATGPQVDSKPQGVDGQFPQPQPAQPLPGQGAASGNPRIAGIIQALSGNRLTAPLAQNLLAKTIEQQFSPKDTDDIREYNLAKSQGFKGSFQDFVVGMKQAGATKVSNVINAGEDAFAKAVGTEQGKRFVGLAQDGAGAKEMVADLNALREIGSRITTGKTAEVISALGPYATALGVDVKGLDDMQAYKSIVSKLAPRMRVPGSGAASDFEMRSFLEALPGLGKTPGGNAIIANTLEAIQQNKIAAAEIASRAISREITPAQAEKMLRELPDPLTNWKRTRGKSPAAPSIEDIDAEMRRRGLQR